MTMDIAAEIATGSPYALGNPLFRLEDVATGIWIQEVARRKNWTLALQSSTRYNPQGCKEDDIVSHYMKPPQQLHIWQTGSCP